MYFTCSPSSIPEDKTIHSGWSGLYVNCLYNLLMYSLRYFIAGNQGLKPTTRDSYGRLVLGDVITSLNGKKVTNGSDLYKILDRCKVGDTVCH